MLTSSSKTTADKRSTSSQSKIQRPTSLYGKLPSDPHRPSSLKPPSAIPHNARSNSSTRVPVAEPDVQGVKSVRTTRLPQYSAIPKSNLRQPAPSSRVNAQPAKATEVQDVRKHSRQPSRIKNGVKSSDLQSTPTNGVVSEAGGSVNLDGAIEHVDPKRRPRDAPPVDDGNPTERHVLQEELDLIISAQAVVGGGSSCDDVEPANNDEIVTNSATNSTKRPASPRRLPIERRAEETAQRGSKTVSVSSTSSRVASGSESEKVASTQRRERRDRLASGHNSRQVSTNTSNVTLERSISTRGTSNLSNGPIPALRRTQEPTSAIQAPQLGRPAFSTLQQHYSPKKTGAKPLTSVYTNPKPQTATESPLSTVRLQAELLQLSLLHEASLRTEAAFHASAHSQLEDRFNRIASKHQQLRASERSVQERMNLLALRDWTSGNSSFGLGENVQLLSSLLKELPPMIQEGGRFDQLSSEFTAWFLTTEGVLASRSDTSDDPVDIVLIEDLTSGWHTEHATLTRRLTALSHDAELMVNAKEGSSLAGVVESCRTCLRQTLAELSIMAKIEAQVISDEHDWVEKRLAELDID